MREEKPKSPSQKNKNDQTKSWFWPVVYSGIAIVFVGMIWGYNAFIKEDTPDIADSTLEGKPESGELVVETNAQKETLKFPFAEALLDDVAVLQEFYDMEADESMREKALLVFNQTYVTSTGVALSMDGKPFEVIASMSGTVEEVNSDSFTGSEVILKHANGMQTVYGSVTEVLVKPGDQVVQGQALATATENESNPTAGVHLHFEVLIDGEAVNPRTHLAF
ncbi:M23 family metallopeptidase [Sporosarcina sp. G11-34]|uniref:M23 family metallopeptidase n=1 Tax=Sporosarcina sp. G11-34 TaxID=2849605 RepID=UPI0022A93F8E|nr:M23 family metallopeptidase [Sporosarcina sp. G11-34]MCZ2257547.1 M23 family metallopeptidase [Sporosarcina sp. G11-34]